MPIQQQRPERWHVARGINLAHIAATVSIIGAGLVAWFALQERVAVLEVKTAIAATERDQSKRDIAALIERVRQDILALRNEVREELRRK